ncbi:phospholipase D-like domain-containing protein [Rhizobium sp. L1K21]|uniref:phospholipase D-like domain-containing protein n=1 Tax=Rhizobium sp. L1K21 TaxID=2954933 RepID=UPI002093170A|nr:phospholipase D-like domain-containing protein [Rhizobium sp. L1K21]MCO6187795.1 phospholipase D-like domain-containing protein [Rhizobium sp. L1K21]
MSKQIMQPGRNVWKEAHAERVQFLVDGDSYYPRLKTVLEKARRSVWIIGWDFNPYIKLDPINEPELTLGDFLRSLVERNEELDIRVLIWDEGPIYSGRSLQLFMNLGWEKHPRIHLHFDTKHPLRASHHQKLVCVDETFAFVGGMDLTAKRWDDRQHTADNPLRVTPDGDPYEPTHDVQALVQGKAAAVLTEVARTRWRWATKEILRPHGPVHHDWPEGDLPDISGCYVGVALTQPGINGHRRRTEAAKLTCDAISEAAKCIYIEAQYLVSNRVVAQLARKLKEVDGPEVVILVPKTTRGIVEQMTMGNGLARYIRKLRKADSHNRLLIAYAAVPGENEKEVEVLIHSKVVIVDEKFLRIGSSNLNKRSEGFDTECDIAIEAEDDQCRTAIVGLRNDLLAEHLSAKKEDVDRISRSQGSVLAAISALNVQPRGLRIMQAETGNGTSRFTNIALPIFDPKKPFWPLQRLKLRFVALMRRLRHSLVSLF